ncbi:MAG: exosortase-associated EpsI family protein [Phycisphaerales bacterium]|nr:exosortase-associated EpsI family protein [Phycisphaerales bacterium]
MSSKTPRNTNKPTRSKQSKAIVILACLSMVGGSVAIGAYSKINNVHLEKIPIYAKDNRQVSSIPERTSSWNQIGSDQIMSADVVETLGTENYLSRNYYRTVDEDSKNPIVFDYHAAYYTGMIDTVPHVPERCFVGGGLQQGDSSRVMSLPMDTTSWRVDPSVPVEFAGLSGEIFTVRLSNDSNLSDAPGTRVRLPRGVAPDSPIRMRVSEFIDTDGSKLYAGYFFIANGGTKANANDVRKLAFNLDDDYAYFLKVQLTSATANSFEEFAQYAGELVGELLGETMRCVPDWVEVQKKTYPPNANAIGLGESE